MTDVVCFIPGGAIPLLLAVIEALYGSSTASCQGCASIRTDHTYVLMACTLLMTQDTGIRNSMFCTPIAASALQWYTERSLGEV